MRWLVFRVARELHRTTGELLQTITAAELMEWRAFFEIEANGGRRLYPNVADKVAAFFSARAKSND